MNPNSTEKLPSAIEYMSEIQKRVKAHDLALFLDFDGTLTPIIAHPEEVILSESMRDVIRSLSSQYIVAIISGRELEDVKNRVAIEEIFYAGNHGFAIEGPDGLKNEMPQAKGVVQMLNKAEHELQEVIKKFPGAQIESKRFSLAIHYRNVEELQKVELKKYIDNQCCNYSGLKLNRGKEVFELGPDIHWDKGKAVLWLLEHFSPNRSIFSIYIGDDLTDENAFSILRDNGIGIVVREEPRETKADYALENPQEVETFLQKLLKE